MKPPLFTLLTVMFFASIAFGAPAETELKTLINQMMDAYQKADTDVLESAMAEEANIVNLDGTVSSSSRDALCFEKQGEKWRCILWQSTPLTPEEK